MSATFLPPTRSVCIQVVGLTQEIVSGGVGGENFYSVHSALIFAAAGIDCSLLLDDRKTCIFVARCGMAGIRATTQVDPAAYKKLLECVESSDMNVCDEVPSGGGKRGGAKLTNPIGGTVHQVDGADRYGLVYTLPTSGLHWTRNEI